MISKIESLTAFCNKLAQDLSKKEVQENQIHIDYGLKGPHMSIWMMGQLEQTDIQTQNFNPMILSLYSPSEIALKMVEISFKISSLYYTRVGLASNYEGGKQASLKIEQQDSKDQQKIQPKIEEDADESNKSMVLLKMMKMVKQNQMKYPEAKLILKKMKIDDDPTAQRWMNLQENLQRQRQLKEEILKQSLNGKISMNEFKKIARKVCTHRLFRPTENWCLHFIENHKLSNLVNLF